MKKSTIGFLLILVIGILGILAVKFLKPLLFEKSQLSTSDAAGSLSTIRIGGDNYLGYWFITSPEMRKNAARKGLQLDFTDDGGAYAARLAAFEKGDYDCIVLPINSYLAHGANYKFPGVIVASISESKGADGIVAFTDRFPSGKINDLNNSGLKIVYTANSPSSFLLDLTIADFDLDKLQYSTNWQVKVAGSNEVLNKVKKGNGDVFVLWEPDLSKALKVDGVKYIWGSDRFSGYIIDVFVFNRDYVKNNPEKVRDFLAVYFQVLGIYSNNRQYMIKEMSKSADLKKDIIEEMIKKSIGLICPRIARCNLVSPFARGMAVASKKVSSIPSLRVPMSCSVLAPLKKTPSRATPTVLPIAVFWKNWLAPMSCP